VLENHFPFWVSKSEIFAYLHSTTEQDNVLNNHINDSTVCMKADEAKKF